MDCSFVLLLDLAAFITLGSAETSRKPSFIGHHVPTEQYTDTWVVQLLEPEHHLQADLLANKHGFVNLGQVCVHTLVNLRHLAAWS